MSFDPAVVSVIVSGLVALAGLVAPTLSGWLSETGKWKREQKAVTRAQIDTTTAQLLESLVDFRMAGPRLASDPDPHVVLLSRFYQWQWAVWGRLDASGRQQVDQFVIWIYNADVRDPERFRVIVDLAQQARRGL